jgi:hypothetical protein
MPCARVARRTDDIEPIMNPILRRLPFVVIAWTALSGDAIVSCSSDPGGFSSSNRAPMAADSFYTVSADGSVTGFMQATDPDGDPGHPDRTVHLPSGRGHRDRQFLLPGE